MDYLELEESTVEEIYELLDNTTDNEDTHHQGGGGGGGRHGNRPSRAYVREKRAMKATPADILEYPNAYHFVIDMPGLKPDEIKVHIEDGKLLVVSGDRRRGEKERNEKGDGGPVKYVAMQRRKGKFLKKFALPDNADTEKVGACCEDGVVTVVVGKKAAEEPKKAVTVEVKLGSPAGMVSNGGSK